MLSIDFFLLDNTYFANVYFIGPLIFEKSNAMAKITVMKAILKLAAPKMTFRVKAKIKKMSGDS